MRTLAFLRIDGPRLASTKNGLNWKCALVLNASVSSGIEEEQPDTYEITNSNR